MKMPPTVAIVLVKPGHNKIRIPAKNLDSRKKQASWAKVVLKHCFFNVHLWKKVLYNRKGFFQRKCKRKPIEI
jgi:hypothetical protein